MSLPHAIIAIAEPEMRKAWMNQITAYSFGYAVNSFAIAAVTSIMKGEADDWMEELTRYLYKNLQEILRSVLKPMICRWYLTFRKAAFCYGWTVKRPVSERNIWIGFLWKRRRSIWMTAKSRSFGPEGEGYVARINFAVTNKNLKEALQRLRAAFGK